MKLDCYAVESQFAAHLIPVWRALPESLRGDFIVPRFIREYVEARGIPTTSALGPSDRPALVASYGDQRRLRGLRTRVARIEHGAGQAYGGDSRDKRAIAQSSYAGGRDAGDVSLFLAPNEYSASRWRAVYPETRVETVGCPKLDTLPAREAGPGPVIALGFHWDCLLLQETRTTFMYYREALADLGARYALIGHGHPRAMDGPPRLRREYRRRGIELVEDFEDVCRRADLYVCDNSSSLFEFAATGRPVVVLNEPVGRQPARGYRLDIDHGLRFETSQGCPITDGPHFCGAAHVGPQVWRREDLAPAIDLALSGAWDARREAALRIVYAHRTGAAKRAAAAIRSWLREPEEEVA